MELFRFLCRYYEKLLEKPNGDIWYINYAEHSPMRADRLILDPFIIDRLPAGLQTSENIMICGLMWTKAAVRTSGIWTAENPFTLLHLCEQDIKLRYSLKCLGMYTETIERIVVVYGYM